MTGGSKHLAGYLDGRGQTETWGISRGGWVTHGMLMITVTIDLLEENRFTKTVKWHWSQCIEQIIKYLKLSTGVRVHSSDMLRLAPTNALFDVWLKRHGRPNRSLDPPPTNDLRLGVRGQTSGEARFRKPYETALTGLQHMCSGLYYWVILTT